MNHNSFTSGECDLLRLFYTLGQHGSQSLNDWGPIPLGYTGGGIPPYPPGDHVTDPLTHVTAW